MLRALFILLMLVSTAIAEAPIPSRHRIRNHPTIGVCWWACVETVGNCQGREDTVGHVAKVLEHGFGRDKGANADSILYWEHKLGYDIRFIYPKNLQILQTFTEKGTHVIAVLDNWGEKSHATHALVVTEVTKEKEWRIDGSGLNRLDYWVTFYDPNNTEQLWCLPWSGFGWRNTSSAILRKSN